MIHVTYTCPHCQAEIVVEVIINEEDDLPDECPECGKMLPDSAHEECETMAYEQAADHYKDYFLD